MANAAAKLSELPPLSKINGTYQEVWTLPKGTEYFSHNPRKFRKEDCVLKRALTIVPKFVELYGQEVRVTWAGSGGYWHFCDIPLLPEDDNEPA